jgi:energy-coupling factor transporter transmembrane protein EcfT
MERLAVALVLLGTLAAAPGWVRLPVAAVGCGVVLLAYQERFARTLVKFLVLWLVFSSAVGAGRYWVGTPLHTLVADTAGSLGLALGVCCAALLVVRARPGDLLVGLDRLRTPREVSYALLSVMGVLPRVATVGARQLALLRLKGLAGGAVQRLRAYPRIVAPLFGVLLSQQLAHARSLGARGFFEHRPDSAHTQIGCLGPPPGRLIPMRGWVVMGLLATDAVLWIGVAALWSE